ncbi:MAG: SpoVG family protein [Eubacteriales bacterium]|jgi:stage V sporulation protein G
MQIRVKIHKVFQNTGAMKAVASVTVDEAFAIHGVKLIETANGRFASMPNEIRKDKDGNEVHRDVSHPISSSARKELEDALFEAFDEAVAQRAE